MKQFNNPAIIIFGHFFFSMYSYQDQVDNIVNQTWMNRLMDFPLSFQCKQLCYELSFCFYACIAIFKKIALGSREPKNQTWFNQKHRTAYSQITLHSTWSLKLSSNGTHYYWWVTTQSRRQLFLCILKQCYKIVLWIHFI